jgi:hypothetical protein
MSDIIPEKRIPKKVCARKYFLAHTFFGAHLFSLREKLKQINLSTPQVAG